MILMALISIAAADHNHHIVHWTLSDRVHPMERFLNLLKCGTKSRQEGPAAMNELQTCIIQ